MKDQCWCCAVYSDDIGVVMHWCATWDNGWEVVSDLKHQGFNHVVIQGDL